MFRSYIDPTRLQEQCGRTDCHQTVGYLLARKRTELPDSSAAPADLWPRLAHCSHKRTQIYPPPTQSDHSASTAPPPARTPAGSCRTAHSHRSPAGPGSAAPDQTPHHPHRVIDRRLVAKHLALVAPLPDRHIAHGVDHNARRTQVIGLDVRQLRHARGWCLDQRHRVVVQPDSLLLRLPGRQVVANPLPGFVIDRDLCTATRRRAQVADGVLAIAFNRRTRPATLIQGEAAEHGAGRYGHPGTPRAGSASTHIYSAFARRSRSKPTDPTFHIARARAREITINTTPAKPYRPPLFARSMITKTNIAKLAAAIKPATTLIAQKNMV